MAPAAPLAGPGPLDRRPRAFLLRGLRPRGMGRAQPRHASARAIASGSRFTSRRFLARGVGSRRRTSRRLPIPSVGNDAMQAIAERHPDRVRWYVAVNPNDTAFALAEIDRACRGRRDWGEACRCVDAPMIHCSIRSPSAPRRAGFRFCTTSGSTDAATGRRRTRATVRTSRASPSAPGGELHSRPHWRGRGLPPHVRRRA